MPSSDLFTGTANALQLSLGLVFLLAVVPKLRPSAGFARTVAAYRLFPRALAPTIARAVILLEALLAVALLTGTLLQVALPATLALLLAFAGAVAVNLRRNRRVPCGCFGTDGETISGRSLGRLALLLAAAILVSAAGLAEVAPVSLLALVGGDGPATSRLLEAGGLSLALLLVGFWALQLPELWSTVRELWRPPRSDTVHEPGEG